MIFLTFEVSTLADPTSIVKPQIPAQTSTPATTQPTPPAQDPIVTAAKSLGLNTEGKTKEELAREIVGRTAKTAVTPSEKETFPAAAGE